MAALSMSPSWEAAGLHNTGPSCLPFAAAATWRSSALYRQVPHTRIAGNALTLSWDVGLGTSSSSQAPLRLRTIPLVHNRAATELPKLWARRKSQKGSTASRELRSTKLQASQTCCTRVFLELLRHTGALSLTAWVSRAKAQDLVNAVRALAEMKVQGSAVQQATRTIVTAAAQIHDFKPQELSSFVCALATLAESDPTILGILVQQAASKSSDFAPQGISNLVWALAKLHFCGTTTLAPLYRLASSASLMIKAARPMDLSNLVWGLAKLAVYEPDALHRVAGAAVEKRDAFKPMDLSQIVWAFATLRSNHKDLLRSIIDSALFKLQQFKPQDLSNHLWAFAMLKIQNSDVLHAMAMEACYKIASFRPQDISNHFWAFATLSICDCALFHACADVVIQKARDFTPQHLSNVIWALATCNVNCSDLVPIVCLESMAKIHGFKIQELTNLLWALAKLEHHAAGLVQIVLTRTSGLADGMEPQQLSNIVWSCATLGIADIKFMHACSILASSMVTGSLPQTLSNMAWAFAVLAVADRKLMLSCAEEAKHHMDDFKMQELSNLVWALATTSFIEQTITAATSRVLASRFKRIEAECVSLNFDAIHKFTSNAGGLLWAFHFAGRLDDVLQQQACSAFSACGRVLDAREALGRPIVANPQALPALGPRGLAAVKAVALPHVVLELPQIIVIEKPAGWEADEVKRSDAASRRMVGERRLSWYLRSHFSVRKWPILGDSRVRHGIIHRLDVPCSGLLLVAKTFQAYYHLKLLLGIGELIRDYVVLCHGWMPAGRQLVAARVHWKKDNPVASTVCQLGKPSHTHIKVVAHAFHLGSAVGLLVLRIATGRRHQIRAHVAHTGFPVVCDGKYSSSANLLADRSWCKEHFLHRYRLAFNDIGGAPQQAIAELPDDLSLVLARLSARGRRSTRAVRLCLADGGPAPWEDWDVLRYASAMS